MTVTTEGSATPAGGGVRALLANRRFLALWSAQILTQVAGNAALYALTLLVFADSGRSSTAVSLLFIAFLVPAVALSLPAGVIVDRVDRRLVLVVSNGIRAAAFAAILVAPGELVLVYVAVLVVAAATTLFIPAEAAMIPRVTAPDQLLAANGLFTFTLQAAFAAGFAVVGPLAVTIAGPAATVGLAAILYLVATVLCLILPTARAESGERGRSVRREIMEGIVVVRTDALVRWPLILLAWTASLIGIVGVVGPELAVEVLGLRESDFILLVLPIAGGLVLGIGFIALAGTRVPRRALILFGLAGLTVGLVLLALIRTIGDLVGGSPTMLVAIAIPVTALFGAAYPLVAAPAQTILQEVLADELRGRVFSVLNAFVSAASLLPILLVGPAADALGIPAVVAGCAVVTAILLIRSVVAAPAARPHDPVA